MGSGRVNIEIIFAGRSNVGKSTLFYQLFGVRVRKGKKPGTTIKPNHLHYRDLLVTDLPGFGYVWKGRELSEKVKDFVVRYIEENADRIKLAVEVIDAKAFCEIAERWDKRGYIPVEVEMFDFLRELGIETVVAANKFDKVESEDVIGEIKKWIKGEIIPTSAKKGDVEGIRRWLKSKLMEMGRHDLMGVFRK
ncbi:GTP-binding protein EngB [Ferroglobus sp.]|uniref:GTP-binding protein EngB n=1 Tax=Ferroglobus sp. TaxID=2614230 RepID=UPI0025C4CC1E|nr:GTP-binding protein EngB [Ferroglobus sp.]